jgi:glyoxylase-like metal-dependent hydrolase (beta-lactamase superfamily II)
MPVGLTPWLHLIDAHQFEERRAGAVYLTAGKRVALVETGTARAVPHLRDALRHLDLSYIFVSHAHLDHAGGAGELVLHHPSATVIAHPRAVRHLADPRRLIEGVREASGPLFPLYGDPTSIPADRLHAAADGERFDLGNGILIETIHSPGHATHHVCFFERGHRILFTGDAVGHYNVPVDLPLTVPPRFDLEASLKTLVRLRRLKPRRLAFTHFGLAGESPPKLFDQYERALTAWLTRIRSLCKTRSEEEIADEILRDPKYAALSWVNRRLVQMCVRGALLSLDRIDR